jgi:hypothetical protein
VRASLAEMPWLGPSDAALAALAQRLAAEIEDAADRAAELAALRREILREYGDDESVVQRLERLEAAYDVTKIVGWLGPQLQGVLRDLGGTPATRRKLQPETKVEGRLAQLRAVAGQHHS